MRGSWGWQPLPVCGVEGDVGGWDSGLPLPMLGLGVSMVHTALAALLQEPQAAVTPHRSPCGVDVLQVWVGQ